MGYSVAIDGPAGAGKSTIAKRVARVKGYVYVDTGAMYRALAIHFIKNDLECDDTKGIIEACHFAEISIAYENDVQQVFLCGENVTSRLRDEAVGKMASVSSAIPEVRAKLLSLQREMAVTNNVVMDGRDIGTCVLPNADVKIFLTASSEVRAKRRFDELMQQGVQCDLKQIEADIIERDERDSNRKTAPLKKADDAVLVDSSTLTIDEVAARIIEIIDEQGGK